MKLAIIGTAGRGTDGERLSKQGWWILMQSVADAVVVTTRATHLVSGGACYADHLAVQLYLEGAVASLDLQLPCEWTGHGYREVSSGNDAGRTSNWYHSLFSKAHGIDSLREIQLAIEKGATVTTGGGFKARNTAIAESADCALAFTFGDRATLKPGGTQDTMSKYLARRERLQYEAGMNGANPPTFPAYHFDLTSKRLFSL